MRWIEALKIWNAEQSECKGNWCIPRRGTKDYKEVREIMKDDGDHFRTRQDFLNHFGSKIKKLIDDDDEFKKTWYYSLNTLEPKWRSTLPNLKKNDKYAYGILSNPKYTKRSMYFY